MTFILVFTQFLCHSQGEIGIGVLSVKFDEQTKINFYQTSELEKKLHTIEFFEDESINSLNIRNLNEHKKWLQPESLWLDYYHFNFRVKSKKPDCYEVYVSDKQTMWIENKEFTDFYSWEEYLKQMFSITRKNPREQKIYDKPDIKAKEVEHSAGDDCFNVKTLKGNWIEIFTPKHCSGETDIQLRSGWIKWRDENGLLINYFPTS